jgi:muconolactone delta-isomerase
LFFASFYLPTGFLRPTLLGSVSECRYHLIGRHGGAWIYKVKSNEELDLLLAMAPVYNHAHYEVLPLADMSDPVTVLGKSK